MGIMIALEMLRRFPFFAGLSETMLKELAMAGEDVTINRGDWLFHEGDEAEALFLIISGEIELKVAVDASATYLTSVDSLAEGEIFGWSALVNPYIYSLGAVAAKNTRLAKFDGVRVCELMTHNPADGYLLMSRLVQIIGGRLNALHIRFVSLIEGDRWQSISRPPSQARNLN